MTYIHSVLSSQRRVCVSFVHPVLNDDTLLFYLSFTLKNKVKHTVLFNFQETWTHCVTLRIQTVRFRHKEQFTRTTCLLISKRYRLLLTLLSLVSMNSARLPVIHSGPTNYRECIRLVIDRTRSTGIESQRIILVNLLL